LPRFFSLNDSGSCSSGMLNAKAKKGVNNNKDKFFIMNSLYLTIGH
jgi:hypothetical protein